MRFFKKRESAAAVNWRKFGPQKGFFADHVIFWSTCFSVLLIIIMILITFFKMAPGASEEIALHYNILIGVDAVGRGWQIYQLPILSTVITAYNLILAKRLVAFEAFAAHLLAISSVVVAVIFLLANIVIANFI